MPTCVRVRARVRACMCARVKETVGTPRPIIHWRHVCALGARERVQSWASPRLDTSHHSLGTHGHYMHNRGPCRLDAASTPQSQLHTHTHTHTFMHIHARVHTHTLTQSAPLRMSSSTISPVTTLPAWSTWLGNASRTCVRGMNAPRVRLCDCVTVCGGGGSSYMCMRTCCKPLHPISNNSHPPYGTLHKHVKMKHTS